MKKAFYFFFFTSVHPSLSCSTGRGVLSFASFFFWLCLCAFTALSCCWSACALKMMGVRTQTRKQSDKTRTDCNSDKHIILKLSRARGSLKKGSFLTVATTTRPKTRQNTKSTPIPGGVDLLIRDGKPITLDPPNESSKFICCREREERHKAVVPLREVIRVGVRVVGHLFNGDGYIGILEI